MRQDLTNSELGAFRSCRARHGFEYEEMLRPHVKGAALTWGNCFHAGLEVGYKAAFAPGVPVEDRARVAIAAALEGVSAYHEAHRGHVDSLLDRGLVRVELAADLLRDADDMLDVALWAVHHMLEATARDFTELVPLGFEVPFDVPVYDAAGRSSGLHLHGKIDAVWWDPVGHEIISDDHKSTDDTVGTVEKRIAFDPQMSGYLHAIQHLIRIGKLTPLDGSLLPDDAWQRVGRCRYNVLRRSKPRYPTILKVNKAVIKAGASEAVFAELKEREETTGVAQGFVSSAQIQTLAAVYDAELVAQISRGIPVTPEQRALLDEIAGKGDAYFARFEFWRSEEERERWRREIWVDARLMRDAKRDPTFRTRNPGACVPANAMRCAYRPVCENDQPETRALYRIADKRHEEVF